MSRRAALPGAAELFRTTVRPSPDAPSPDVPSPQPAEPGNARTSSGRRRHNAKITVYVGGDELVSWEQARLELRAEYGITIDRGRLIREAVAMVLADLDQRGADSALVGRLGELEA